LATLFLVHGNRVWGQQKEVTPAKAVLISPSFSIQFPGGDLDYNFGTSYSVGLGAGIKTASNWLVDGHAYFMFGSQIDNRQEILGPVLSSGNNIFNQTGNYAQVNLFQRGIYGLVQGSKVFNNWGGVNANSGPVLSLGAGYMYHWIRLENLGNDAPQILDEYHKGYDQLRGGFMLKQSLGYLYLSKRRRVNFQVSFEVLEAFTQNLRGYNYSTGKNDTSTHMDLIYAIRFNWYLPIYKKSGSDEFYYD
tara:strand:- start:783 stop:1526 length:744 start_codon:yes stop_codon:yes gene_type:complete